jgi:hypothetical protein
MGYYEMTSMTLITMQAGAPNHSVPPLPALSKTVAREKAGRNARAAQRR